MISRRQLIGSGMAVSALGLAGRDAFAATPSTARPTLLLVDTRFVEARAIARDYLAAGFELVELPRDVLDLWHQRLQPITRSTAPVLAGITTGKAFFILQTLAADRRLRVQSVAVHGAPGMQDEGPLLSWVMGPATRGA